MSRVVDSPLGQWLTSHGGYMHPSLYFRPESSGHAVCTADELDAPVCLAMCPNDLAITPQLARAALAELLSRPTGHFDDHTAMCLYLVSHKLSVPHHALQHGAYLESLPTPEQLRTALYFSPQERQLLKGTNLVGAIEDREATWRAELEAINALLGQELPWELHLFAATMLSSRAFPSTVLSEFAGQDSTPILLPGVDAFNHRRGEKVSWLSDSQKIKLQADSRLKGGSEVFNNYGLKSNEELLLGYGFCLEDNPDDALAVKLGFPRGSSREEWESKMHSIGLTTELRHLIGRDGQVPPSLLAQMRLFLSSTGQEHPLELEMDVLSQLSSMLQLKLTALEAKEEEMTPGSGGNELQQSRGGGVASQNGIRPDVKRLCATYRQGQVEIARAAIEHVEGLLDEGEARLEAAGLV